MRVLGNGIAQGERAMRGEFDHQALGERLDGVAFFLIHRFGSTFLLWGIVGMSWVTALIRIKNDLWWNGANYRSVAIIISGFFLLMALVALGAFNKITW